MRSTLTLVAFTVTTLAAAAAAAAAGPIDGHWDGHATRAQLLHQRIPAPVVDKLCGDSTDPCPPAAVTFAGGRFHFRSGTGQAAVGSFSLVGNIARFVFQSGVGVKPGQVAECRWSVYRDQLTFSILPGRRCLGWDAAPWVRTP
jgi:hypothetical protein